MILIGSILDVNIFKDDGQTDSIGNFKCHKYMDLFNNFIQSLMKSTLKIVLLLVVIQLTMQAGFDCSVEGCALCTYPDMCGQCNNNWVLMQNSTTGAFYCNKINCVDNCDSCYEDNVCQTCSTGFFLTSSGGCSSTQTSST